MSTAEIPLTHSYSSIRLLKSSIASKEFQQMAEETTYGTPGGMRYSHTKSTEKIKALEKTSFLEFKRSESTLGIVALVGHNTTISQKAVSGLYVRYFSMLNLMPADSSKSKKGNTKKGLLHQDLRKLFDDPKKLSDEGIGEKTIVYSFIESTNDRSLNIVKSMGFQPSRKLVTILFSRFYPKNRLEISQLSKKRSDEIKKLLQSYYKEYNLVPEFNRHLNSYYVHEVDGEIICGLQLEKNTWHIHEMPGIDGWLFKKILPIIPILNKIFQKSKIDFIGVERLYVKSGYEHLIPDFLETLCSEFGVTKALIGVDNQSSLHTMLKKYGKLGILDKLISPSPGLLFTRTYGIDSLEKRSLSNKPFYVSTYNMS